MNLAVIQQIFQVLIQGVSLAVQYGPEIIADLEEAWKWATTSDTITPEQQQQLDNAIDAAHAKLQAAATAAQQAEQPSN